MKMPDIHQGDLVAKPGTVYQFEQITGSLYASGADTKTAFPKLTTVGGSLDASGADTKTAFPKLTTVGGSLDASRADTKTAFPKLTTVGSYLYARGADTKTAFPKLTTVGGSLDASGADTKTAFPKLTTVGGYLDASGADTKTAFPKLTKKDAGDSAKNFCRAALVAALSLHGFTLEDGILARVISSRGGVKRVRIVGQAKISYIVQRDGHTAHGATLSEARADLLLKMGNRDTTPYRNWTTETKASLQEMIVAYRTITGACQQGVSHFLTSKNYKGKLSVQFVINETQGRYGHETFKKFFTK